MRDGPAIGGGDETLTKRDLVDDRGALRSEPEHLARLRVAEEIGFEIDRCEGLEFVLKVTGVTGMVLSNSCSVWACL